ncbi:MAG TPA: enoyl-CoA hydratase/isomerase family protein [Microthrixaceae bacterium]|nr:enoyl-CoA hydratase/isomerase family protein [Microthrixaceae bacterium]
MELTVRSITEAAALARSPLAAEMLDGTVVVDLDGDTSDIDSLAAIPRVVVGIARTSDVAPGGVDVVVEDEAHAARIVDAVAASPIAATTAALHLRSSIDLSIGDALVAESTAYSMLQAGPEHARWLAGRARDGLSAADDGVRVRVERRDGRLHVALARPGRRNAVDAAMQAALIDAFATAGPDEAIVLTGDGTVFSSGGDLDEFGTRADPATAHLLRLSRSPARAIAAAADRTTAIVQGSCYGAGVELPAFAGHVIADPATTFTLPEVRLGLIPGAGGTVSIPRRIGRHRTAWLAITGASIDAPTALDWGLVDALSDE